VCSSDLTGGIGMIAIGSIERFKGGLRVEFLCGSRALGRFRVMHDQVSAAMRLLSSTAGEVPAAIGRLQRDAKDQRRAVSALEAELSRYRAVELSASADETGRGRLVCRAIDADANGLKTLASAIVAQPGYIAVLVSAARPSLVVVARSADRAVGAGDVVSALIARCGGRGGGRPEMAQGGGLDASPEAILAAAREVILA
jgi:alanyl-tRNA synthetase